MSTNLTEKEIKDIGLGYNWNPSMDYDAFAKANLDLSEDKSWEIYNIIDRRYCYYISENV